MYNGELITFRVRGKEELASFSLYDINIKVVGDEFLLTTRSGKEIGYIDQVAGIDITDLVSALK